MKRRDLERKLRVAGCFLKREGGSHSLWLNPKNGTEPRLRKKLFRQEDSILRYGCCKGCLDKMPKIRG